jgi:hypothetical protein
MPLYHLLLDADAFHRQIRPALSASWRRRSFEPCRPLCSALSAAVASFARRYHTTPDEALVVQVAHGLPFDRTFWHYLAGELLWYSACDIPEFQTAPDTLRCLLAPGRPPTPPGERSRFVPVEQAHFGSRDLAFGGGLYRPEHAGYNDADDVTRLADYLAAVDPGAWTADQLAALPDLADAADRAEEIEYVHDWFPELVALYRNARVAGQLVVCEIL